MLQMFNPIAGYLNPLANGGQKAVGAIPHYRPDLRNLADFSVNLRGLTPETSCWMPLPGLLRLATRVSGVHPNPTCGIIPAIVNNPKLWELSKLIPMCIQVADVLQ
jgi:hypothetical protein